MTDCLTAAEQLEQRARDWRREWYAIGESDDDALRPNEERLATEWRDSDLRRAVLALPTDGVRRRRNDGPPNA